MCESGYFFRHACRSWNAEGGNTGTSFDEQSVGMAVITAFKLNDELAASRSAGNSNRRHGGFCAGADKSQFFDRGIASDDAFSEISFNRGRGAKARGLSRRQFY